MKTYNYKNLIDSGNRGYMSVGNNVLALLYMTKNYPIKNMDMEKGVKLTNVLRSL